MSARSDEAALMECDALCSAIFTPESYHMPGAGGKVRPVSAEDVRIIRLALELLEMIDEADGGEQARHALAALDRIAGKEE
jgi:hypothetical protein